MREYFLFIDTETTGVPKEWNAPYSKEESWPHAVQISWIIYTRNGTEVKREDHYIKNNDFTISSSAENIHGITRKLLKNRGESRKTVMQMLANDLNKYKPLVLGHFMKFDFHIAGAEFYRTGIENPLPKLPTFCTMLATTPLVHNPARKYMRLNDLHEFLFNTPLPQQHNALVDAQATADCFFELVKRGIISEEKLEEEQKVLAKEDRTKPDQGRWVPLFIIALIILTIVYFLWKAD